MSGPRALIAQLTSNPRLLALLERTVEQADAASSGTAAAVAATERLEQATVLVLSPNGAFAGEYVLKLGAGLVGTPGEGEFTITLGVAVPKVTGGHAVQLAASGPSQVALPLYGQLATISNPETLANKTLSAPKLTGLGDYADDTAAAAGGVAVGGVYRTGSALKVRVT